MNDYQAPPLFFNKHIETIFPSLFRKVSVKDYLRERITTADDDFLDLDWLRHKSDKLVIISHGLEGNSQRPYVKGMAKAFYDKGYDVLAWNYRGCSDEMNHALRFYHSGATDDLHEVARHASTHGYKSIFILGFSLGGNLTLKYAGEKRTEVISSLKGAITFSVPLDLHDSCQQISLPSNKVYANRFLRSLKEKILRKAQVKSELNTSGIHTIRDLISFDDHYTAPIHGFRNALEYYHASSSVHYLSGITIPTLIVNALNDPFLGKKCFPSNINNPMVTLETPARGGHVGFAQFHQNGLYWSELRALAFAESILP